MPGRYDNHHHNLKKRCCKMAQLRIIQGRLLPNHIGQNRIASQYGSGLAKYRRKCIRPGAAIPRSAKIPTAGKRLSPVAHGKAAFRSQVNS